MCSYNRINGVYSSENPWLLNKVLRDEWGFDGFVMSDWGAVNDRPLGVESGLDLEMPTSSGISEDQIIEAVESGRLKEEYLDKAVEHILNKVNRYTGFMDVKNGVAPAEKNRPVFDYVADHKEARKVAREGMVLLKNDGALPLNKDQKILFIGEFAKKPRYQGGGSSHINPTRVISALSASTRHTLVDYAKGFFMNIARLTILPFFHAILCALAVYFIGFAHLYPGYRKSLYFLAIMVPTLLHGLYDTCTGSIIGTLLSIAIVFFAALLLTSYLKNDTVYQAQLRGQ